MRDKTEALREALAVADVIAAIYAVDNEARDRGRMFPQTSDEQAEDRSATARVVRMIQWYEKNTGCSRLKGWPALEAQGAPKVFDMSKPPTLTADDAHGTKSWPLADIYTRAFDEFAGPKRFRHGSNDGAYHRAGLIAVWNAALAGIGVAAPSSDLIARCKRIMALVDAYVERPTSYTRGDIRVALMDEFASGHQAQAVASSPTKQEKS